jgi:hypothetical protein
MRNWIDFGIRPGALWLVLRRPILVEVMHQNGRSPAAARTSMTRQMVGIEATDSTV